MIMKRMEEYGGKLPFNDKVDPEVIKQEFGLSKNAFKRAVGRLLKEGHIKISEKNIKRRMRNESTEYYRCRRIFQSS